MKIETQIIHKGRNPKKHLGTVNPPISQSSTVVFPTLEAYNAAENGKKFYENIFDIDSTDPSYGISGGITVNALQEAICAAENGYNCVITPSGLSAITMTLQGLLQAGDHLLLTDSIYGPVRRFCNKVLKKFGVEVEYYKADISVDELAKHIKENTKILYLESPGTFTFEVQDIEPLVKLAKKHNIYTIIDNSWGGPVFFQPLDWGVDISITALTKYVSGHADILLGSVVTNEKCSDLVKSAYKNLGMSASAHDCYLALRGLRTIAVRMKHQMETTKKVIEYLKTEPAVKEILYPADEKSEYYPLYKKYFKGAASLFSVILDKKYSAVQLGKMADGYELFGIGASWGGYESLVKDFNLSGSRVAEKWADERSYLRYYLGLEDADDIITDLKKGFERLQS